MNNDLPIENDDQSPVSVLVEKLANDIIRDFELLGETPLPTKIEFFKVLSTYNANMVKARGKVEPEDPEDNVADFAKIRQQVGSAS